ncbi:alpha/beta-hydrolase [Tilletiaria anomala UBC 951]|uniref:Alpha/beta-hydrolase n=1 Tax=Tilletiaria anomala (strain ATCC 24038 / CBS 436.72 / UBC 951) TaxID=1037660 RepID=A0A066VKH5_TILAU|nr:alpha/beta-hydrolase [Tilletiaria anomala UBC 951]KDN39080.1 alpha/beta-hydrolase [Tilletiaria anomala UBC 951]
MSKPRPFRISVPETGLDKLAAQLSAAELPDAPLCAGSPEEWSHGTSLQKLKSLVDAWRDGSPMDKDGKVSGKGGGQGVKTWWRSIEDRLNRYPHFKVEIEEFDLHFIYVKSQHAGAIPLVFSHGWPGSFYEAWELLPYLVEKDEKTGMSFDVVVPSLPGYAWSNPGSLPHGWNATESARRIHKLMTQVLGYKKFFAHGGDWGTRITRLLANYPECKIYHTNFAPPTNMPWYTVPAVALHTRGYSDLFQRVLGRLYSPFEVLGMTRGLAYLATGSGYVALQSTKPATLGYALYNNPVGILAYLLEKFHAWTDPRSTAFGDKSEPSATDMSDETILVNTTIYALTNTIHTSLMLYFSDERSWYPPFDEYRPARSKPYGHSAFAYELARGPRPFISRLALNLVWYKAEDTGGHFAGW